MVISRHFFILSTLYIIADSCSWNEASQSCQGFCPKTGVACEPASCPNPPCCACPAESSRRVRWYVSSGRVDDNVEFAREHSNAITGFYGCCGLAHVDDVGNVTFKHNISDGIHSMMYAVPNRRLTYHAVFGVTEASICNGTAIRGIPDLVDFAKQNQIDGLLCDYEPSENYTETHAKAYANFLDSLAQALHEENMEMGFDVAGWGILDFWDVYAPLHIDFYTSMSPTYNAKNISQDKSFVTDLVAAVGSRRTSIGIGSVPDPNYVSDCKNMPNYTWTNETFTSFTEWLRNYAGVSDIDIWRCDIDHYGKTADWYLAALERFLL